MNFLANDARLRRRQRVAATMRVVLLSAALVCVAILVYLLWQLASDGVPYMTRDFFTTDYSPRDLRADRITGIQDAVQASLFMLALTMAFAIPVGTAAGVYLHEYAPSNRLTRWLRSTISNLAGVPSVVYGLLGLAIFLRWFALGASILSAALTLAVLILPILIVATEESLKTIPHSVREASLALGATKWQTIRKHVIPYALPGILTGNILALSRAAGETAPLLMLGIPAFVTIAPQSALDAAVPLQVRAYFLASDARTAALDTAAACIVVLLLATLALNLVAIVLRQVLSNRIKW